ncbi:MAG: DUF2062 domain-containing protein [Cyanobacteria bacterium J06621_8]
MSRNYHQHNASPSGNAYRADKSPSVLDSPRRRRHQAPSNLILRRFRLVFLKLLRLRGKPEYVARGLAVGVFAGCFPFLGLQSLIGILLATLCRGSKVAAVAATWISNPLTYFPLFVFNYKIGKLLLGTDDATLPPLDIEDIESFTAFKELGSSFAITLLTGSFMLGVILGLITYFYGLAILEKFRHSFGQRRQTFKNTNEK